MVRRILLPSRLWVWCAAMVLAVVPARMAHAQAGQRLNPEPDFSPKMEKEFKKMISSGPETELDDKTKTLIDSAAQYYAYRFTHQDYQKSSSPEKTINRVFGDLEAILRDFETHAKKGVRNEKVRQLFLERLVARLKQVVADPLPIVSVNGARALALVAEFGYEGVAGALLEVVQSDKQSDGAKFWALVGLKELLRRAYQTDGVPIKDKDIEASCIQALTKVIDQKGPAMDVPREQLEGFRVLRREAVRALAQVRVPALVNPKDKSVKARPALPLLRVLADPKSFTPEPRLEEQVEAAVGLARMDARGMPDYLPDYAAEHIGRFVVLLAERSQDAAAKDTQPWRIHAARLGEGLEMLRASVAKNVKDKDVGKYVADMSKLAIPILQTMQDVKTAPRAGDLNSWLAANTSPSKLLFRDVPESEIKPAAEKTETPPEKTSEPKN